MPATKQFELAEAAKILGVHQSTLRRWADAGKISHIKTLSGRRRFTQESIERARQEMQQVSGAQDTGNLELKTLAVARQYPEAYSSFHKDWYEELGDEQRMLFRYSGQRLLGLLIQFTRQGDAGELYLEEGKRIAADYGQMCFRTGLGIEQTVEAFLYFRRSMLESVQETSGTSGSDNPEGQRTFLRMMDFFDALLLSTLHSYKLLTE